MRRFVVPAVIAAVAVVFLIVLAAGISSGGPNNSIQYSVTSGRYKHAPAYNAQLPSITGVQHPESFGSYRGKLVLVNFFASWCEPCQAEAPLLATADRMLRAHDGTVVGIAFQNSPTSARSYVNQHHLDYPTFADPGGEVATAWGISQVPDSYLINRVGKIVWFDPSYQLTSSTVNTTLPELISKYS